MGLPAGKGGDTDKNPRKPAAQVDRLFLDRWSPRAFDSQPLPEPTVAALFEAARWAPSCFNEQPWLFVYATREPGKGKILEVLNEGNRIWAGQAPLLAVLFTRKDWTENGKPNRWAGFDCGAAWMSFALQARLLGLYAHAMGGFNRERVHAVLNMPADRYEAMCVIAAGKHGDPAKLPKELREREEIGQDRKPPADIAVPVAD